MRPLPPTRNAFLIGIALLAISLPVFWPVTHHQFIELDDNAYLIDNPRVTGGLTPEGVAWAFTTDRFTYWHPLTWLSHMAAVDLYGLDPGGHHGVNLILHLLNVGLLFLVLCRMTGGVWQSGFAAALFAIHPLHVEPVAWVAARTELLGTLFWLLALLAYRRFVARRRTGPYLLVVACFALGLMAKPMLVTLPFTLLLLDYWPLGRFPRTGEREESPSRPAPAALRDLVREKIPLFALSAVSALVTVATSHQVGFLKSLEEVPFGLRAANVFVSYAGYLVRTVWPASLSIFYPYPAGYPPAWRVAGSALLLAGVSWAVFRAGKKQPWLPVGWFWYLGTLVPVIGWVQAGDQAAADRYAYVPLIGVFLMVAWGVPALVRRLPFRAAAMGIAGVATLTALGFLSRAQVGTWRDSVSVFRHAIDATTDNWLAHYNLGSHLLKSGRYGEAEPHFREAVRIRPSDAWACNNLGVSLLRTGRNGEAAVWFGRAVKFQPDHADAHYNLGRLLLQQGDMAGGIRHLREAVRIDPEDASARRDLEWALKAQRILSPQEVPDPAGGRGRGKGPGGANRGG